MAEIISESSVAEAKTGGAPMDADELRLAQMGIVSVPQDTHAHMLIMDVEQVTHKN